MNVVKFQKLPIMGKYVLKRNKKIYEIGQAEKM